MASVVLWEWRSAAWDDAGKKVAFPRTRTSYPGKQPTSNKLIILKSPDSP